VRGAVWPGVAHACSPTTGCHLFGLSICPAGQQRLYDAQKTCTWEGLTAENSATRGLQQVMGVLDVLAAGQGAQGFLDAANASARLNCPRGGAVTPMGVVIADSGNNRLRLIANGASVASVSLDAAGVLLGTSAATLGGNGTASNVNGPLASATFGTPMGLAYDAAGDRLYVSTSTTIPAASEFVRVVSSLQGGIC
jgi:hypothetical protein